jgi:hypothetical protein
VHDKYSRAASRAVWEAIHAGERGEPLDRVTLVHAASGIIFSLLQTTGEKEYHEIISDFAILCIQLTTSLDRIVQNSGDDDENLVILRVMAQGRFAWPTMVRPGDYKFSDASIKKLGVGKNNVFKPASAKRPASFSTPRNRLAAKLIEQLCFLARLPKRKFASRVIKASMVKPNRRRTKKLVALLKGVKQFLLLRKSWPLTKDTVTQWNGWLSNFVLITDPQLETYLELQKIRSELEKIRSAKKATLTKTEAAYLLSSLEKFFHPALKSLAR